MNTYEEKIAELNNKTTAELMKINSSIVKPMIEKFGGEYKRVYINREFRKGNRWNSEVEAILMYKDRVYIRLYVQNSSTDTTMDELFDRFFINGKYVSSDNNLDAKVVYNIEDKAEVARAILQQYAWFMWSDEHKKKELIEKIGHYTFLNPILDYFFKKYNLWYSHIDKYSSRSDVVKSEGYTHAKKVLNDYIAEHCFELQDKSKEELTEIYKGVFQDAVNAFDKNFDFNEWRKKHYYF